MCRKEEGFIASGQRATVWYHTTTTGYRPHVRSGYYTNTLMCSEIVLF